MNDQLFNDLLEGLDEASAIFRKESEPNRQSFYVGKVLVEERENGERTWSLPKAAETLVKKLPPESRALINPKPRFLRESLRQTQEGFAQMLGMSVDSIRAWEQGKRNVGGAARTLLNVVAIDPMVVLQGSQMAIGD